ncbi:MAG: 3-phosphoglycerate dehydrogenase, partial [Lachnospiraceae bacterium]|nr:3-phosphoglycerate dehydrogenase [Lachnospiraceae bacterium]
MYRYKCLNPIANVGLSKFDENYAVTEDVNEADAILVRSAAMHEMELPKNLLAIARAGAGVNNIPLDKCAEEGIVVFNTPGANANGVKELVIAGLMLASRDIVGGVNWVQTIKDEPDVAKLVEKGKSKFAGQEIKGKKLGVIGLGAIGVLVANAAKRLGMEVYGCDPYISVQNAWILSRDVIPVKTREEIYEKCDYITVHVPLIKNDDPSVNTQKMIDKNAISIMKDGVIILNFARDLLVDDDALEEGLASGKIAKYVTDFPNARTAGMQGV